MPRVKTQPTPSKKSKQKPLPSNIVNVLEQAAREASVAKPTEEMVNYARRLVVLKEQISELEAQTKLLKVEYDKLQEESIPTAMMLAGIVSQDPRTGLYNGSFTLKDGTTIYLQPDIYVTVLASDREKVHKWLRKTGAGALVIESVNASSLKSHLKSMYAEEKKDKIPDFVKIHEHAKAFIRKPTRGKT